MSVHRPRRAAPLPPVVRTQPSRAGPRRGARRRLGLVLFADAVVEARPLPVRDPARCHLRAHRRALCLLRHHPREECPVERDFPRRAAPPRNSGGASSPSSAVLVVLVIAASLATGPSPWAPYRCGSTSSSTHCSTSMAKADHHQRSRACRASSWHCFPAWRSSDRAPLIQAVIRNPLANPSIIGINSGAALFVLIDLDVPALGTAGLLRARGVPRVASSPPPS